MTFASRIAIVAFAASMTAIGSSAQADDNHHQNYLIGERAVGMGGAFTAIANDSSGTYYNPAGLSEIGQSSLSLSAAVYGLSTRGEEALVGQLDSDNVAFIVYPTTGAWIREVLEGDEDGVGRLKLAASILTPRNSVDRRRFQFSIGPIPTGTPDEELVFDQLLVRLLEDETLWAGLSVSYKIHSRVSIGATVFGAYRSGLFQSHESQAIQFLDAGMLSDAFVLPDRTELTFKSYGVLAVLGALLSLTDEISVGASFRTPQLVISASADVNVLTIVGDGDAIRVSSLDVETEFRDRQPWKATVGVAYEAPSSFALALDFSLYGPVSDYNILRIRSEGIEEEILPTSHAAIWQLNVGGEYYPVEWLPLRAGVFTNLSSLVPCDTSNEACDDLSNPFVDIVDRYGFSASVGYEVEQATLNIGASYNFGSETVELDGGNQEIEIDSSYLFLLVGGSFRF